MDFTLNYMDLVSTTEDEVSIDFDLLLHNPSIVSASYSLDVYACVSYFISLLTFFSFSLF